MNPVQKYRVWGLLLKMAKQFPRLLECVHICTTQIAIKLDFCVLPVPRTGAQDVFLCASKTFQQEIGERDGSGF